MNSDANSEFCRIPQMVQDSGLGKHTVRRVAQEAGALVKIGRIVLINRRKFFDYLTDNFTV